MMFPFIVLFILIFPFTIAIPCGNIPQAQLITIRSNDIWLYNQSSWSQCMCQALQYHSLPIVAFNFFSSNNTCQLVPNNFSSSALFYLKPSLNSTCFILSENFLHQIQSICCFDLPWLMNQIQQPNTFRNTTITTPFGLALDNDLNKLIVTFGRPRLIQFRGLTGNMAGGINQTIFMLIIQV